MLNFFWFKYYFKNKKFMKENIESSRILVFVEMKIFQINLGFTTY
jgi:hypothetical protein